MSIRQHPESSRLWQVRYRDASGRQRTKTFPTKTKAKDFDAEQRVDKRRGELVDPDAGRLRFSDYATSWSEIRHGSNLKPSTIDRDRDYLRMMLPTFGDRQVRSIKPTEIDTWLAGLDVSSSTCAKALQKLRAILELARRDGAFKVNPAADVKAPDVIYERVGRALTDAELESVLYAAEVVNEDQALIVWLMARCGLRVGEAVALGRSDMDFAAGTIRVERTLTKEGIDSAVKGRTRADEGRTIPMPEDLEQRARRHISEQAVLPIDGRLVTSSRGMAIRYSNWRRRVWSKIVETAGVGDLRAHDLRHTCATRLFIVDRWTPGEVQAFLGHKDPRITLAIYTHVDSQQLPKPKSMWTNSGQEGSREIR